MAESPVEEKEEMLAGELKPGEKLRSRRLKEAATLVFPDLDDYSYFQASARPVLDDAQQQQPQKKTMSPKKNKKRQKQKQRQEQQHAQEEEKEQKKEEEEEEEEGEEEEEEELAEEAPRVQFAPTYRQWKQRDEWLKLVTNIYAAEWRYIDFERLGARDQKNLHAHHQLLRLCRCFTNTAKERLEKLRKVSKKEQQTDEAFRDMLTLGEEIVKDLSAMAEFAATSGTAPS
ncbi:hypothetical protein ACOMHN_020805 [Nucella lapillus]